MKLIKKSISLPEDIYKFAEQGAAQQAKARGSKPNLSAYMRELLAKERNRPAMAKAA